MYKGRHCIPSDYQFLEKISQEFLSKNNWDNLSSKEIDNFVNFIKDYDEDIAFKVRIHLEKSGVDSLTRKKKIIDLIDELKNNVLVDSREHN